MSDTYTVSKKKSIISVIKSKHQLTQKSAERIYDINLRLKQIRNMQKKKFHLDREYGDLMIEKTQLMYKNVIL